nr:hypothetical protein [Kibdelosporangium sp. MJ126-NF4]CTQ92902.1 hypothetical protein [Kibdelosporangium sp. MJ126-NF4]
MSGSRQRDPDQQAAAIPGDRRHGTAVCLGNRGHNRQPESRATVAAQPWPSQPDERLEQRGHRLGRDRWPGVLHLQHRTSPHAQETAVVVVDPVLHQVRDQPLQQDRFPAHHPGAQLARQPDTGPLRVVRVRREHVPGHFVQPDIVPGLQSPVAARQHEQALDEGLASGVHRQQPVEDVARGLRHPASGPSHLHDRALGSERSPQLV